VGIVELTRGKDGDEATLEKRLGIRIRRSHFPTADGG